jgi:hypothetical protein
MGKNLTPVWGGIVCVIAYLYGLLVTSKLIASEPDTTHGLGLIMTYIMKPIVFLLVSGITSGVLTALFGWIKDDKKRANIALPAIGVFFVMYGLPSLLVMSFAIGFYLMGYFYCQKLQTDERDLSRFMKHKQAENVKPADDYLDKFSSPLWDLIDLENCKPLTIVEGVRGGRPFVVIEMQHLAYGLLAENGKTATSTFFIVKHLKQLNDKAIKPSSNEYQVSVDRDWVYLVIPSKKIRPANWEEMLTTTVEVAATLKDHEVVPANQENPKKTYTPVGPGVIIESFWLIVYLVFAVIFLIFGLVGISGMVYLADTRNESVVLGWQSLLVSAITFGAAFLQSKKVVKRL